MANKTLFQSIVGALLPATDTRNAENAPAYAYSAQHALAQYAATGCLNHTFYATAEDQLKTVLALCQQVEPEFIARTALYCRSKGFMKDLPALLCAVLSVRSPGLLAEVFDRVIDSPKMLRNFVQIMRSGAVGRKSLGTLPKRLVLQWIERRDAEALFRGSVGNDPSLADIIKMVHPKPANPQREAIFGYLIGKDVSAELLPDLVRKFEAYKAKQTSEVPDVPFQMLTALDLGRAEWAAIARTASWQTTRMNLNTFARHGVFEVPGMTQAIAERLRNPELIAKARVFPYQLMVAYTMAKDVPGEVREALQDAMEIALRNVPTLAGKVYVFPDVSGSMKGAAVTGARKGATSAVRCVDAAALVAAAIVRKNPSAEVIPFEERTVKLDLNSRDSVMTNATKLASVGGGGTNCSAPLAELNARQAKGDVVIYVSDNESWVDARAGRGTATMVEWNRFKQRNPAARMVCIDLVPNGTTQASEQAEILNIGGFSDQVFEVIARFADNTLDPRHWVGVIEAERI